MDGWFEGRHFRGRGDHEILRLLDAARRMFEPDPEFPNLSMLYTPEWNGLVEGPRWGAWWIQNSYGPTYCLLPFLREPFLTFLQNAQDLWFDQMGDGRRTGGPRGEVAPDGALCDCARPGSVIYKQGDGRTELHDWGLEFTAAGVVLQAELLLIARDAAALARYLPRLERCMEFLDQRRDPRTQLFLAGPAANLLAPSYAGMPRGDGTFVPGYLAGLSVTYLAALDRMIELQKMAGASAKVAQYQMRRDTVRQSLPRLCAPEGYFVKSVDPETGEMHGVYGGDRWGYFEAAPNHDAVALRIVDEPQAARIYDRIARIPGLRPHGVMIANYPSLDDMYETGGIFEFGRWVNGGHWSTCEARVILGYFRLGRFEDAWRSFRQILRFATAFRLDNPLTDFGNEVWFTADPVHLCYDALGPAAALVRGLYEYLYTADGLTLVPHLPPEVRELQQLDPVRLGSKRLYISTVGSGPVRDVRVNNRKWALFDETRIFFPYDQTPAHARVEVALGRTLPPETDRPPQRRWRLDTRAVPDDLLAAVQRAEAVGRRLRSAGLGMRYEAAHARLVLRTAGALVRRRQLLARGRLPALPEAALRAADEMYGAAVARLEEGLGHVLEGHRRSGDADGRRVTDALGG